MSAGLAAIGDYVAGHGVAVESHRQADGSGLSRWNLVPADQFVTLLRALRSEEWFDAWHEALPVAGDPDRMVGGTLTSRMRDTAAAGNAYAKTGTLTSVSALSGYVTDGDGRPLVFAILLNNHLDAVKVIEDRIVVALAEFSVGGAGTLPTSVPEPATPPLPADVECSWLKPARC
ncbi:D-alanyl-D-alanine carboxypeptidase [Natronosporangium hydrolyticum]|uniref:D-alanyl-D-alanine carboxypeptidase n=1 Tax=Natronosporangium hydrolyticum TaxID=2811111 RepID=A0A895YCG4_9ACTN|nr:D-alanyl-D-alanine carboxypeptidase [Natronosporangium hydrolyticum]QSB13133.1 D-alanyl-D-alanine carboxypeptidase [Natronosporangium hydrolyticum]